VTLRHLLLSVEETHFINIIHFTGIYCAPAENARKNELLVTIYKVHEGPPPVSDTVLWIME
jgi:hypothetical protein